MSPQKWPPETRWICLRTSTLSRHHDGPRGRAEVGPRHAMENGRLEGVLGTRTVWQGGMSRGDERKAELSPAGILCSPRDGVAVTPVHFRVAPDVAITTLMTD